MQRLEVSSAVQPLYGSLGVKWLIKQVPEVLACTLSFRVLEYYIPYVYLNTNNRYVYDISIEKSHVKFQ
jgi:hypothetical protein